MCSAKPSLPPTSLEEAAQRTAAPPVIPEADALAEAVRDLDLMAPGSRVSSHTILPRMVPMSLLEKARKVCVLTLPSLATESEKAVMVSSSGASNTATTS